MENSKIVSIVYTNYKGITSIRQIIPKEILFGHNEWHAEDQWLMIAYDIQKRDERTFALKDIKAWYIE